MVVLTKIMAVNRKNAFKDLMQIPGIGKSIATDLINIGIESTEALKGKDPERLFDQSNAFAGTTQDRCLLYVFRCAVYFAETPQHKREPHFLKWWNWKDVNKFKPTSAEKYKH
jgi:hypothetical protein